MSGSVLPHETSNSAANRWIRATLAALLALAVFAACSSDDGGGGGGTGPSDTKPPSLISVSPADLATGVGVASSIVATFSENIDATSATPSTFSVDGVAGTVSAGGTQATFFPSDPLAPSTSYTVRISQGITDVAGNALDSPYVGSFTTGDLPHADAGEHSLATMGATVTLDATGSTVGKGESLEYQWTQLAGPSVGSLSGAQPSFTAPNEITTLWFELVVVDQGAESEPDMVRVVVVENASRAFFVHPDGDDSDFGSPDDPFLTIGAAMFAADTAGGGDIYAAAGSYAESVILGNGVSIYGGFSPADWSRDIATFDTEISGGWRALHGESVSDLTLEGLIIRSADALSAGGHSIAASFKAATNIDLVSCVLIAGNGAKGADGGNGATGVKGDGGNRGDDASGCPPDNNGGGGGSGYEGGNGGTGGKGGLLGGHPGSSASGASGSYGGGGAGGSTGNDGKAGEHGRPGGKGADGGAGAEFGTISGGNYLASNRGARGKKGGAGLGGGGGGGGGGAVTFICGAGGGGGGEGSGGGTGGYGGYGGGSSVALLVTFASSVDLTDCELRSANGAQGGAGGKGGAGGTVGGGGSGGGSNSATGSGGKGGNGGKGGSGGYGGGGGGGSSVGILASSDSAVVPSVSTIYATGNAGLGGERADEAGNEGLPGLVAEFKVLEDIKKMPTVGR